MSGSVEGKVVFITGAARGQGRSHAVRLAEEGADIIAVDICDQIESVDYEMSNPDDLEETVRLVESRGRRIVARQADVRDLSALEQAVKEGVAEFGRLDVVIANAAICTTFGPLVEMTEERWQDTIDVGLTGAWKTCRAAVPQILAGGRGGSVILISSAGGMKGLPNLGHYSAAKHGVIGLMRSLALELGPESVRVNAILPGSTNTPMMNNPQIRRLFFPDSPDPLLEDLEAGFRPSKVLPIPWLEPRDQSEAVLFLASDASRYITAATLSVDGGMLQK